MLYYTYILQCADGTYYVGHSSDLPERLVRHHTKRGARFTASRLPAELVFYESYETRAGAMNRERRLKHWSKRKKEALINGDVQTLKHLGRCRSSHPDQK